jgi:hypothetical protein
MALALLTIATGQTHAGRLRVGHDRDDRVACARRDPMTIERALRLIAGAFVAASVLLGIYVSPLFLWFTLFVGLNLFQSAFTNWCPMMAILRKSGLAA